MPGAFSTIVLVAITCIGAVNAQPFEVQARPFQPDLSEPGARIQDDYTGFTFNFNGFNDIVTPNGMIQANQIGTNPFLSTLHGDGNGQTLVTLGPCASNTPHTHPRGAEISFLLFGAIQFGMIEENGAQDRLVIRDLKQNETIHIPQGLLHFSFNPNCSPAAFLANFATRDPGTQTMWQSMFTVPTHILNAASGLPEPMIDQIKKLPFVIAPGTGGEECLKRCGLKFNEANSFVERT